MTEANAYRLASWLMWDRARLMVEMRPRRTYGETPEEYRAKIAHEFDPHAMTELAELILSLDKRKGKQTWVRI